MDVDGLYFDTDGICDFEEDGMCNVEDNGRCDADGCLQAVDAGGTIDVEG